MTPSLPDLLERYRENLVRFLGSRGSGLLRYETAEDLAQGVHLRALEAAEKFEYQGESEFLSWLFSVARQHIAHRHEYWSALKRDAGHLLRVTAASAAERSGVNPAAATRGPATLTARKEVFRTAMRAVAAMSERDHELVSTLSQGVPLEEVAERLGLSYKAAQRARHRAVERFRKAYEVIAGGR